MVSDPERKLTFVPPAPTTLQRGRKHMLSIERARKDTTNNSYGSRPSFTETYRITLRNPRFAGEPGKAHSAAHRRGPALIVGARPRATPMFSPPTTRFSPRPPTKGSSEETAKDIIMELLEEARRKFTAERRLRTTIYFSAWEWELFGSRMKRPLHSVHLPEAVLTDLVGDMSWWLGASRWYQQKGKWRRWRCGGCTGGNAVGSIAPSGGCTGENAVGLSPRPSAHPALAFARHSLPPRLPALGQAWLRQDVDHLRLGRKIWCARARLSAAHRRSGRPAGNIGRAHPPACPLADLPVCFVNLQEDDMDDSQLVQLLNKAPKYVSPFRAGSLLKVPLAHPVSLCPALDSRPAPLDQTMSRQPVHSSL